MKPILSESGHAAEFSVASANALLQQAAQDMAPLALRALTFSWHMIHFGQKNYNPGDHASDHIHRHLHLESVLNGVFRFEHEDTEVDLKPNQSLLFLPDTVHAWECKEAGVMLGALIDVSGSARQDFFHKAYNSKGSMILVSDASCATRHGELLRFLTAPPPKAWHTAAVSSALRLLLIDLLNSMVDLSPWRQAAEETASDVRSQDLCRHAQEFLESNYPHPIQVRDIALQLGISPRHLNRVYRKVKGESIGSALQKIRLEQARRKLREHPEELVKSIAFNCGFSSHAYFTACYRKAFGRLPAEDRYPES